LFFAGFTQLTLTGTEGTSKGDFMNTKNIAKGLLFGASLLLASAAFAGEKASVKVFETVKVSGKTLPAGVYNVSWEGTGSNVQVSIQKGKETVATIPAQLEASNSASASSGYSTRQEGDGSKSITTVFFAGKKYSLNFDQQAAVSAQSATTPGNK
jgi:hypothetical protein